jgi:mRNA interferase HicA
MKRRDLMKKIRTEAKRCQKNVTESEGGRHSKITVGSTSVRMPRHRVLNADTARGIMQELEGEFGKGWWRL